MVFEPTVGRKQVRFAFYWSPEFSNGGSETTDRWFGILMGSDMVSRLALTWLVLLALSATAGCDECGGPTAPCNGSADLSGFWSGSSTYPNAPFTMDLRQAVTTVTGRYQDQRDHGSVNGTVSGSSFVLDVNFGDTGIRLTGTVQSPNRLTGETLVPVLGGRRFPFEMVR